MEISDIKRCTERYLSAAYPTTPISYEGVNFMAPPDVLSLAVQYILHDPTDPTVGTYFHFENMEMQVFVRGFTGSGTGSVLSTAESIKNLFKRGTTFLEGTTRIHVLHTPKIKGTIVTSDRLVVPVVIPLTAEVYSS